ncbi:MAG: hypothetical protein V4570_07455 [Pseudomonadota bacterium]
MQTHSNNHINQKDQRKGRVIFLMMLTFFVVPIIAVVLMFKFNFKPAGESRGELITPPRLIQSPATLQDNNGKDNQQFWAEKWNMVYVTDTCEAVCMQRLRDMRQIHVSLYKDIPRTQRVLITHVQDLSKIKKDFPDLTVVNQTEADIKMLSAQFNLKDESALKSNRLYFVDPLGHIMMSYPENANPVDIRKDLARLLRYSWAA